MERILSLDSSNSENGIKDPKFVYWNYCVRMSRPSNHKECVFTRYTSDEVHIDATKPTCASTSLPSEAYYKLNTIAVLKI